MYRAIKAFIGFQSGYLRHGARFKPLSIYGRGYDAPHSEWRGIGRILQGLLFSAILTKAGSAASLKGFQSFPFPPGWLAFRALSCIYGHGRSPR